MYGKTHYLQTQVRYAGIPTLDNSVVEKLLIPIPSLEEQTRIVGILDTFTSAIDNLKEQIAQRRKQYEYYRDQLLDLEGMEGVEMKSIKDVCRKICSGGTPSGTISVLTKRRPLVNVPNSSKDLTIAFPFLDASNKSALLA